LRKQRFSTQRTICVNLNEKINLMNIVNKQYLSTPDEICEAFQNAQPFRHVQLKDFLEPGFLEAIRGEFPDPPVELVNEFGIESKKHVVQDIRDLGPTFKAWDQMAQSPEFLQWLSAATGIADLLYDPEYHGAGTHNNMHGQRMEVHVDFNYHRTTGYHRRLNLIVYISEVWEKEWGGSLELHKHPWEPEVDLWVNYPCFGNHAVLFETNEYSWHGFEEIDLPEDKRHLSRKSLTIYFYTKERPKEEIGRKHSTIYVPRPMPATIQPGRELTEKDYVKLARIMQDRNYFVQGLYNREMDLQEKIDNQQHLLNLYANAFQVPMVGFVKQIGKVQGLLPTMVVQSDLKVEVEALRAISHFSLEGFVPKFVNSGKNTLSIYFDGILAYKADVKDMFKVQVPLRLTTGQKCTVSLTTDKSVSPKSMGLNEDETTFMFVLALMIFE